MHVVASVCTRTRSSRTSSQLCLLSDGAARPAGAPCGPAAKTRGWLAIEIQGDMAAPGFLSSESGELPHELPLSLASVNRTWRPAGQGGKGRSVSEGAADRAEVILR